MRAASAIVMLAACACSGRHIEGTPDAADEPDVSVDPIVDEPVDDPALEGEDPVSDTSVDDPVEDPAPEDVAPTCDAPDPRTGCTATGGAEHYPLCCPGVADFPVTCGADPCGCPEIESHNVASCECGEGRCFDGLCCVTP